MPLPAVDGSSPIRFTGTGVSNTNIDSASFTAPANALLVLCVGHDGDSGSNGVLTLTISLATGAALTWTQQVAREWPDTNDGGASYIYTAPALVSEARVVRINSVWTVSTSSSLRRSAKLYVVTDADLVIPVDPIGANNEGTSQTNNINTTSIVAQADGLLMASATDWTAGGGSNAYEAPSDGSTQDTANYSGAISVVSGYRAVKRGELVNMNLNAGGAAAAQHKWGQLVVRGVNATQFNNAGTRPAPFKPGLAR